MDFSRRWKQFLSESPEIEGGALFTADGELITSAAFGKPEILDLTIADCASLIETAHELTGHVGHRRIDTVILEGEHGYLVLMPILEKTVFAVLAGKQVKLGLLTLDMMRAIDDGSFGPGLIAEGIIPPRPPKRDTAHAAPEDEWE